MRKTEWVTEMAVGSWQRLEWTHGFARQGMAALVLGALAVAAWPVAATAQRDRPGIAEELFPGSEPPRQEPLAVAYLAASYAGAPLKGPSRIFRSGAETPATALFTRLVGRDKRQPWEGEVIELFTKGRGGPAERLTVEGGVLGLGGRTPLSLTVYAFIPESRPVKISRVKVWDSDAWYAKPDEFSILADTSFHLEAYPLLDGRPASWSKGELIACVNKRSNLPAACDGETGGVIEDPLTGQPALLMLARGGPPEWLKAVPTEICVEGQPGYVVQVPDSSQPIPLDQKAGDRWCSPPNLTLNYIALREEGIQIDGSARKRQLDSRFASAKDWQMLAEPPKALPRGPRDLWVQRIVLHPPVGAKETAKLSPQPPSSFDIVLNEVPSAIRRIKSLWYTSIPSPGDAKARCENRALVLDAARWTKDQLTEAEDVKSQLQGGFRLKVKGGQPVNPKHALALVVEGGDSQVFCGVATPVPGKQSQFAATLVANEDKTALTPETPPAPSVPPPVPAPKKADSPLFPPGAPVSVVFKSRDAGAVEQKVRHATVQNDDGAFADVDRTQLQFTLPEESGFVVTKCTASKVNCRHDSDNIELLPKAGATISSPVVVTLEFTPLKRSVDLTVQREGPALLSIQQITKGKSVELLDPQRDKGSMLTKVLQWSPGDKLRVRPVDDDFQEVSEITVDGKAWEGQDDIALKPGAKAVAIAVKTADRLFTVPLTVTTTPRTAVDIRLETRTREAKVASVSAEAQTGQVSVPLKDVKPEHVLTVEPQEKERLEVATMLLRGGKAPRGVEGPKLKLERSDFQLPKLALSLDINLRESAFDVPERFRLQPVVQIGKRELLLKSCKVEIADFLDEARFLYKSGYTEVTLAQDRRAPKTRTYAVRIQTGAPVCNGLEVVGQPVQAAKLSGLRVDATLPVPVRRPDSRAFVGIVSLSPDIRSKEHNWRAALEALSEVFDAGAKDGKYLWGAIYGPQGELLVTSGDTADYAPFNVEEVTGGSKMDALTGEAGPPFASLVTRVATLIADMEGNVDTLVVADEPFGKCGWSGPPFAPGSRAAFVRLTSSVSGGKEIVSGVRICAGDDKKSGDKSVVSEVEVVTKEWSRGAENDVQLRKAIAEAAKGFQRADLAKAQSRPQ